MEFFFGPKRCGRNTVTKSRSGFCRNLQLNKRLYGEVSNDYLWWKKGAPFFACFCYFPICMQNVHKPSTNRVSPAEFTGRWPENAVDATAWPICFRVFIELLTIG